MDSKLQEIIDKVISGEMVYSYSSIRELLKSPLHFLQYKTGEKKTTDAMRRGVLIHKLLLEPDDFGNEYVIFEKPMPSATMAKKENKEAYQALQEANPDKLVISSDELADAKAVEQVARQNKTASEILDFMKRSEVNVKFEYKGLPFTGFIDIDTEFEGMRANVDLKISDPTPDKIRWKVRDMRYDVQGYMYNFAVTVKEDDAIWYPYFLMALNETGVSVTKIGSDYLTQGKLALDRAISAIEELKFLTDVEGAGCWLAGMEFWAKNKKYFIL